MTWGGLMAWQTLSQCCLSWTSVVNESLKKAPNLWARLFHLRRLIFLKSPKLQQKYMLHCRIVPFTLNIFMVLTIPKKVLAKYKWFDDNSVGNDLLDILGTMYFISSKILIQWWQYFECSPFKLHRIFSNETSYAVTNFPRSELVCL